MWLYNKEAEQIEVITHLETGAQVMLSGDEVWWRGNTTIFPETDRPGTRRLSPPLGYEQQQVEMRLTENGARRFGKLVHKLRQQEQLIE